jgi:hypothetical protein
MSMYQPKRPPLCRPSEMMLTASTMATASISTRTNSLTELATATGWSCTCASFTPSGSCLSMPAVAARSALPSAMMSPPLVIDTPSAITSLPWWCTLTEGGSM